MFRSCAKSSWTNKNGTALRIKKRGFLGKRILFFIAPAAAKEEKSAVLTSERQSIVVRVQKLLMHGMEILLSLQTKQQMFFTGGSKNGSSRRKSKLS
jgi:hypothetical protein